MNKYDELCSHVEEILIVDDVPANLKLLAALLQRAEYSVRCAISGEMALRSIQSSPADLILLDITMPDMDGYEVCRRLKADPATAEIPVIFVSALDAPSARNQAFAVGGLDYIVKPYRIKDVLSSVRQALKRLMAENEVAA
jgi:CheY-like chemotaxis protein